MEKGRKDRKEGGSKKEWPRTSCPLELPGQPEPAGAEEQSCWGGLKARGAAWRRWPGGLHGGCPQRKVKAELSVHLAQAPHN